MSIWLALLSLSCVLQEAFCDKPVTTIKAQGQTSMSSTYQSNVTVYGPDKAKDGAYLNITGSIETCQCCSVTGGTEVPWWRIDFGKQQLIGGVNITGRPGNSEAQSKNITIFISNILHQGDLGELIWRVPSITPGSFFSHTFVQPIFLRYLTIMRPGVSHYQARILTICEVELIHTDCAIGRFGDRCSRLCHCQDGKPCDLVTGRCQTPGCMQGSAGNACECIAGHVGTTCSEKCGHCIDGNSTCSPNDGQCLGGCSPGYDPSDGTCKTECQRGHYGYNCTALCGHCIGDATCLVTDGTCPGGCDHGYLVTDPSCKTALNIIQQTKVTLRTDQSSQYGNSDSTKAIDGVIGQDVKACDCCSQTQNAGMSWWLVDIGITVPIRAIVVYGRRNASDSDEITGFSIYLSTSATFPSTPYMNEPKPVTNETYHIYVDGRYTRYIKIQRPGALTVCEVEVFLSDETCPPNTYSFTCVPCGHCKDGVPCGTLTGRCLNGCDGSYTGELCTLLDTSRTNVQYIVGSAAGGVVCVLAIVGAIIAVCMFYRRRNNQRCTFQSTDYEQTQPSREAERNVYDALDLS